MINFEREPQLGPKDYIHFLETDGERSYEFNPQTGLLRVAMSQSSLESLIKDIGDIPKEGAEVTIELPRYRGIYTTFRGVKKVYYMPRAPSECHWNPIYPEKPVKEAPPVTAAVVPVVPESLTIPPPFEPVREVRESRYDRFMQAVHRFFHPQA